MWDVFLSLPVFVSHVFKKIDLSINQTIFYLENFVGVGGLIFFIPIDNQRDICRQAVTQLCFQLRRKQDRWKVAARRTIPVFPLESGSRGLRISEAIGWLLIVIIIIIIIICFFFFFDMAPEVFPPVTLFWNQPLEEKNLCSD